MGVVPLDLEAVQRQAAEIRRLLHEVSNQSSVVHLNLVWLTDNQRRLKIPADVREALQDSAVAATGLVENLRQLQMILG